MQGWQLVTAAVVMGPALWVALGTARGYTPHWRWGVLVSLVVLAAGAALPWPGVIVWAWWSACAGSLAVVDAVTLRLPNRIQVLLAAGLVPLAVGCAIADGHPERIGVAALGAVCLGAFYLVLFLLAPRSIGMGDLKLALSLGWLGGFFSFSTVVSSLVYSNLAAVVVAVVILARGGSRKSAFSFGPLMIFGMTVAVLQLAWAHPFVEMMS